MSGVVDERITDEVEALEAILMDDVTIFSNNETGAPEMIETKVFPSTGADADQQYVCVTLQVILTPDYPDAAPTIKLKNPRGLDDSVINIIQDEVNSKLLECTGQPVVFELIEVIREHLTDSNLPSGQCVICLYGFRDQDLFTKTPCYHHFHSHCLACHLVASEKNYKEELDKLPPWQQQQSPGFKASCPVCRENISFDLPSLLLAAPPFDVECARHFEVTSELKALQAKMAALFLHQQNKGGIIDILAEESKMLLVTRIPEDDIVEENYTVSGNEEASGPAPADSKSSTPSPSSPQHHNHNSNQPTTNQIHQQNQSQISAQSTNQNSNYNNVHSGHRTGGHNRGHWKNYRGGYKGRGHSRRQAHQNEPAQPCLSSNR